MKSRKKRKQAGTQGGEQGVGKQESNVADRERQVAVQPSEAEHPESEARVEEARAETATQAETQPQSQAETHVEVEPSAQLESQAQVETQAEAEPQAEAETQPEAAPEPVGPPIRVAAVSYLNAAPLVWGLIHGPLRHRFRVENTLPSQCADMLRAGEADAGLIPSIEYQRIENLKIVPVLSISSSGPVRSVLLVSRVPLDRIQSVALDTASRTSACLLEILFQRHFRISPRLVPHASDLKTMLRVCDAALLIGDPALDSDLAGLQAWDLAEEWKRMTGLPFVFAFWAVRAEAVSPDLVFAFHESALHAIVNLRDIIQQEAQRTGLAPAVVRAYLTENIDYSFGEKNLVGLRRFYSLAQELGLVSALKPLQFVE